MKTIKMKRKPEKEKNPAAVSLGRLGGEKVTAAKSRAARENGKLGGRPRTKEAKRRRYR